MEETPQERQIRILRENPDHKTVCYQYENDYGEIIKRSIAGNFKHPDEVIAILGKEVEIIECK